MERAIVDENIRICVVCRKNIKKDKLSARKIEGFWVCSSHCTNKFLKEKKMWTPKEWGELCKMQALYEERKRAEITTAINCHQY